MTIFGFYECSKIMLANKLIKPIIPLILLTLTIHVSSQDLELATSSTDEFSKFYSQLILRLMKHNKYTMNQDGSVDIFIEN